MSLRRFFISFPKRLALLLDGQIDSFARIIILSANDFNDDPLTRQVLHGRPVAKAGVPAGSGGQSFILGFCTLADAFRDCPTIRKSSLPQGGFPGL
jgi:hypothetical protein